MIFLPLVIPSLLIMMLGQARVQLFLFTYPRTHLIDERQITATMTVHQDKLER